MVRGGGREEERERREGGGEIETGRKGELMRVLWEEKRDWVCV